MKTILIIISILALLTLFLSPLISPHSDKNLYPTDMSETKPDTDVVRFGQGNQDKEYYIQPELSAKESIFCKGMSKSGSCSERAIHPLYENAKELGIDIPQKQSSRKYTDRQNKNRFFSFLFGD